MPVLIIEHDGQRRIRPMNGRVSIGRVPGNDIVIDHPAVSRRHARIEADDGAYRVLDENSKNGVLVADQAVKEPFDLQDGDRIVIGPAVIVFRQSDSYVDEPGAEQPPTAEEAGSLITCDCGARLWVPVEMAGALGQCRSCGQTLRLGEQQSRSVEMCAVCNWEAAAGPGLMHCPSCGLAFHVDCWTENRGCAAYGCSQVNAAAIAEERKTVSEEIGHPPAAAVDEDSFPWGFALLGSSVVGTVIGVFCFGLTALVPALGAGWQLRSATPNRHRRALVGALVVGAVGTIAGVMTSGFWWLGWSLSSLSSE